jgi:hypothetical protein
MINVKLNLLRVTLAKATIEVKFFRNGSSAFSYDALHKRPIGALLDIGQIRA